MKKASEIISESIMEDISNGVLDEMSYLDEAKLSKKFNVSRTPVREALTGLVAKKILERRGSSRIWVKSYSKEELEQIFETMQEIEIICAKLAARRLSLISKSEILKAQEYCVKAAELDNRNYFLQSNDEFHQAIYRATKNEPLCELASNFRYRTKPFRSKSCQTKNDFILSIKAHEAIINTILGNDQAESDFDLKERMSASYTKVLDLL